MKGAHTKIGKGVPATQCHPPLRHAHPTGHDDRMAHAEARHATAQTHLRPIENEQAGFDAEQADSPVQQADFSPPRPRRCPAITRAGTPCKAPPLNDADHCLFHSPATAEAQHDSRRQGGIASGVSRRSGPADISPEAISLSGRPAIQALLDAIVRLELTGRLAPTRTRNLLRALSLAIRNLEESAEAPPALEGPAYEGSRHALDTILEDVCDAAYRADAGRRAEVIGDAVATKEGILRAVDEFSSKPSAPSYSDPAYKAQLFAENFPPSPIEPFPAYEPPPKQLRPEDIPLEAIFQALETLTADPSLIPKAGDNAPADSRPTAEPCVP